MTPFKQALKNLDHLSVFMGVYIEGIEKGVSITFNEYLIEREKYVEGTYYYLTHSDGTKQKCLLDYFPLPGYSDIRVLVECGRHDEPTSKGWLYWKEVPVKYLTKT